MEMLPGIYMYYEYLAGEERVFVGMESTIDSC